MVDVFAHRVQYRPDPLQGLRLAANHNRQCPRLRAGSAAADRGVEIVDASFAGRCCYLFVSFDVDRTHLDEDRTRIGFFQYPTFVHIYRPHIGRPGQTGNDHVRGSGDFRRPVGRHCAGAR